MDSYQPYKSFLGLREKRTYETVYNGLKICDEFIKVMNTDVESISKVLDYIRYDNPIIFYANDFDMELHNVYTIVKPRYHFPKSEIHDKIAVVNSNVTRIVQNAKRVDVWNDLLLIHDLFCRNIIYKEYGYEAHTILGAINNKSAVCEGIAKAFKHLCDYLEIPSCVVTGDAHSANSGKDEAHAWNKVNIGDNWYNIDVTFDLTSSNQGIIRHDYFCVDDSVIRKTHKEDQVNLFPASDKSRDYYMVNNLIMHNQQYMIDYLCNILKKKVSFVEVKIPSTQNIDLLKDKVVKSIYTALSKERLNAQFEVYENQNTYVYSIKFYYL